MSFFVYNPQKSASHTEQWIDHLQRKEYFADVTRGIRQATANAAQATEKATQRQTQALVSVASAIAIDHQRAIEAASTEQAAAIQEATRVVSGTMEKGFALLNYGISDLSAGIERMAGLLDDRLTALVHEQRVTNLLTQNVAELLRIPDVQKERQHYVEQGLKHFANAALDEDFYRDAIENLLEAEVRQKTDYLVLYHIGLIYMFAPRLVDLGKAEDYLRRAGKYAIVESDPRAARVINILSGDVTRPLRDQDTSLEVVGVFAAKAYLHAANACFIQGKYADALELAQKSVSAAELPETRFMEARTLAALDDDRAADVLVAVVRTHREYALKSASDPLLASRTKIREALRGLRDEATANARSIIDGVRAKMLAASAAVPLLDSLVSQLEEGTLYAALGVLDELGRVRKWTYSGVRKFAMPIQQGHAGYFLGFSDDEQFTVAIRPEPFGKFCPPQELERKKAANPIEIDVVKSGTSIDRWPRYLWGNRIILAENLAIQPEMGTVHDLDAGSTFKVSEPGTHRPPAASRHLSEDGRLLARLHDGTFDCINIETGEVATISMPAGDPISNISPDGSIVAIATPGHVWIGSTRPLRRVHEVVTSRAPLEVPTVNPDDTPGEIQKKFRAAFDLLRLDPAIWPDDCKMYGGREAETIEKWRTEHRESMMLPKFSHCAISDDDRWAAFAGFNSLIVDLCDGRTIWIERESEHVTFGPDIAVFSGPHRTRIVYPKAGGVQFFYQRPVFSWDCSTGAVDEIDNPDEKQCEVAFCSSISSSGECLIRFSDHAYWIHRRELFGTVSLEAPVGAFVEKEHESVEHVRDLRAVVNDRIARRRERRATCARIWGKKAAGGPEAAKLAAAQYAKVTWLFGEAERLFGEANQE